MYSLLLVIIYLSFISLGLPDTLLGSGWPSMSVELDVPMSFAGIITMIIAGGTIVSSLKSDYITKKFGTALVTAVSVAVTAVSLFGFALANNFGVLCLLAIPYGLGAGAVDSALNNYVALNLKAKHMSWLHCFWGVGASISPYIMSFALTKTNNWHNGYFSVSIIQVVLTAVLFLTLPLWKKQKNETIQEKQEVLKFKDILKLKGVKLILIGFFCFCSLEQSAGIWATSFLVNHFDFSREIGAKYGAYFYLGITIGRFICGFVAEKLGDKKLIRIGCVVTVFGIIFLNFRETCLLALVLTGFGTSPIYPAIIHSTPMNFGEKYSAGIIGIEMASAYTGVIVAPAFLGFLSSFMGIGIYPIYLMVIIIIMIICFEKFNSCATRGKATTFKFIN